MNFDSALFLFVAGLIVGGAATYLLYARIAVVAARLESDAAWARKAYDDLKALIPAPAAAPAAPAPPAPAAPAAPAALAAPAAPAS